MRGKGKVGSGKEGEGGMLQWEYMQTRVRVKRPLSQRGRKQTQCATRMVEPAFENRCAIITKKGECFLINNLFRFNEYNW